MEPIFAWLSKTSTGFYDIIEVLRFTQKDVSKRISESNEPFKDIKMNMKE